MCEQFDDANDALRDLDKYNPFLVKKKKKKNLR